MMVVRVEGRIVAGGGGSCGGRSERCCGLMFPQASSNIFT